MQGRETHVYHITRLTAVVAMCNVGCKLVACGDAHTFTVTLIKNFLYNRSPLMADECQRDAAIGVLELVCSMLLLSDTTTMCQFPSQVIPQ